MTTIGAWIRELREGRGWSQDDLAAAARLSGGYLSKLERGVAQPSAAVLQKLAGALNLPLADLYRAAGLAHLLERADPALDPALDVYVHQIDQLPAPDRAIIIGVLQQILAAEQVPAGDGPGQETF